VVTIPGGKNHRYEHKRFLGGLFMMAECKVQLLPVIELHLFRTQPVIDQTNTIRTLFNTYFT